MERNEIKRFILNFIELQKRRATLQEQIVSLENNLKKTTYALENAKENKARIENSSISIFFLGVLGKKEERLEQEEINIETSNLVEHIKRYNEYASDEIEIDYYEDWMDNKAYWDGQEVAVDSHGRIKRVNDWFLKFNSMWNEIKDRQDEIEERMRKELYIML